ncbi:uncharacterized protein CCOS01_12074 [Colletotrichum costaricense]|uniref:Uncharacterized protein n=1 Tax=Colletotrichum costaricense TaxID=1209916 RepID=A0AAI9YP99_9PEZI|nr:uncharacterized protein CCOS01_12074 [Colletotrichum costaricense]KAK1517817.1 hypothetical protein CCOS01_12074 [Colletotrichum costaricense]
MSASAGTCNAQLEEHEVPRCRSSVSWTESHRRRSIGRPHWAEYPKNCHPKFSPSVRARDTHHYEMPCRRLASMEEPRAASAVAHRQRRRSLWLWLFLTPRMCVPLTHITRPVALHPFCVVADDPQGMLGSSRQEGDGLVVDEYEAHSTKSFHTFHTDTILHLMQVGISRIRPIKGSCSHRLSVHGRNAQAVRRTGRSVPGRMQIHIEEKGLCSRVASEMCSKPPLVPR